MNAEYLQQQITNTERLICVYDQALLSLAENPTTSYSLDTGQTITKVTRSDMGMLQKTLDSLYNRLATLQARMDGSGSTVMRPCW